MEKMIKKEKNTPSHPFFTCLSDETREASSEAFLLSRAMRLRVGRNTTGTQRKKAFQTS